MIERELLKVILDGMRDGKINIIYGPRQSGKTTLLKQISDKLNEKTLWLNADEIDVRSKLQNANLPELKSLIGNYKVIIIDEAQRIENIGITLKLIIDNFNGIKIFASGSSSFELANKIKEPLTGRKWEYLLLPISFAEMTLNTGLFEEQRRLEQRLIFGAYPEIILNESDKEIRLRELADSYLYKDIIFWEKIKKVDRIEKLLQALAFQVGSEVSYNELSKFCGLDNETVEKYIYLLEQAFIIFRLNSFSRNLRSELKKSKKIYFYDNGIRNSIIGQFKPINLRDDIGALWENYVISERKKLVANRRIFQNEYFWRTNAQKEIDYIEERNGEIYAYEFKWNPKANFRTSKAFIEAYNPNEYKLINPINYNQILE